ncbi:MAG: hypothetical protein A2Z11_02630 [Candidatus Woykebacteria bacterium RBG_16_43_9]|uniref:Prepilin-type N-terminal cleavage/methylation domain-containing protein n=1 Tax=Candidatus Woykebacteria bacterium RBG_16_43_9 TaxID=1802596 RepID=A0A1G1WGV4_9BACT|nr:MAG: hypothetical protein A2Z11_02630 [Candidatus Woykebacteria bacterium RBG_16_43_9]
MIERLRSHLGKTKGFTLVELLIVIAIIAILVLLVIVAIDPLERIQDAQDRNAQNEVRSGASAVAACITKELARTPSVDPFAAGSPCSSPAALAAPGADYISNEASLGNLEAFVLTAGNICLEHLNPNGHNPVIWNFNTGQVTDADTAGNAC